MRLKKLYGESIASGAADQRGARCTASVSAPPSQCKLALPRSAISQSQQTQGVVGAVAASPRRDNPLLGASPATARAHQRDFPGARALRPPGAGKPGDFRHRDFPPPALLGEASSRFTGGCLERRCSRSYAASTGRDDRPAAFILALTGNAKKENLSHKIGGASCAHRPLEEPIQTLNLEER